MHPFITPVPVDQKQQTVLPPLAPCKVTKPDDPCNGGVVIDDPPSDADSAYSSRHGSPDDNGRVTPPGIPLEQYQNTQSTVNSEAGQQPRGNGVPVTSMMLMPSVTAVDSMHFAAPAAAWPAMVPNLVPAAPQASDLLGSSSKTQLDALHGFTYSQGLQIRVLGVPQHNAKSRVETQIKLCLQLVTDKGDKVPLWSHLRLPEHLIPKERLRRKKDAAADCIVGESSPPDHAVLNLETLVVCASDVTKTVTTCLGCIQRERKRARKKEANTKSTAAAIKREDASVGGTNGKSDDVLDDESLVLEQKKVILLNCAHMVDFSSGDTILPTRITCYCRHHGEKVGFCVYFIIRDYTGRIAATGLSPPIMITDDHKSSKTKPVPNPTTNTTTIPNAITNTTRKRQRMEEPMSPPMDLMPRRQSVFPDNASATSTSPTAMIPASPMSPMSNDKAAFASLTSPTMLDGNADASPNATGDLRPDSMMMPDHSFLHHHDSHGFNLDPAVVDTDFMMGLEPILPPAADSADYNSMLNDYLVQHPQDSTLAFRPHQTNHHQQLMPVVMPTIHRVIPAEGPLHGGLEITILGSGFYDGLTVMFGGMPATRTHFWGETTMVCVLPPAPVAGPVPVTFKDTVGPTTDTATFTYKDDADRALMELALQVLGLRMTGKLEDARQIAMRIVADPTSTGAGDVQGGATTMDNRQLALDAVRRSLGLPTSVRRSDLERLVLQMLCNLPDGHDDDHGVATISGKHTILHLAVLARMTTLAKWIVHATPPACTCCWLLDRPDVGGFTPLHLAAWTGSWSLVVTLLEAGGNHMARTVHGFQPAQLALAAGHRDIARLLFTFRPSPIVAHSQLVDITDDEDNVVDEVPECHPLSRPASPASTSDACSDDNDTLDKPSPDQLAKRLMGDDGLCDDNSEMLGKAPSSTTRRFVDRPRRGKRGRGGRGGAGTQHRGSAAITTAGTLSLSEKEADNEEGRPTITAEELLYNLAPGSEEKPAEAKSASGGMWYFAPLAQLPTLFAFPASLSASTFGFGGVQEPAAAKQGFAPETSFDPKEQQDEQQPAADPADLPPPPYTPAAHNSSNRATTLPTTTTQQAQQRRVYPQPPSPTHHHPHHHNYHDVLDCSTYPAADHDADLVYLNQDLAHIQCDCVSYSGTHETRCARYRAMLKRRKEAAATLSAGSAHRNLWTFWVPLLLFVIILILVKILVSDQDVEQLMAKIENVHADILGPVRGWFDHAKRWGVGQSEDARAWLNTVEQKGRAIVKVGRLVV
ncbi:hypothetical protein PhCBS80983_g02410 [Powellomyces hirtus]|uniref:IPT/TIG domain-containing protein n=1 Tax=Powellomyces hirtus TaxID=109895 RepID=A0A507E6M9_9FUNG|nr:hypothetical protein PhCBS80983_g02410 [Powellomyces hirtus]